MNNVELKIKITIEPETLLPIIEINTLDHNLGTEETHQWMPSGTTYNYTSLPIKEDATTKIMPLEDLENPEIIISQLVDYLDKSSQNPQQEGFTFFLNGELIDGENEIEYLQLKLKNRLEDLEKLKPQEQEKNNFEKIKDAIKGIKEKHGSILINHPEDEMNYSLNIDWKKTQENLHLILDTHLGDNKKLEPQEQEKNNFEKIKDAMKNKNSDSGFQIKPKNTPKIENNIEYNIPLK